MYFTFVSKVFPLGKQKTPNGFHAKSEFREILKSFCFLRTEVPGHRRRRRHHFYLYLHYRTHEEPTTIFQFGFNDSAVTEKIIEMIR